MSRPRVEVSSPKYAGVDVDHPRIIEATKTALKRGIDKDQIAKVVGMPREVIDRIERESQ